METEPRMVSLKTVCQMYEWKYDTIWKKWKQGEFVQGYYHGRMVRFLLSDVEKWATRCPVESVRPSLIRNVI